MSLPSKIEERMIKHLASHNFTREEAIKIINSKDDMEFVLIREFWEEIQRLREALRKVSGAEALIGYAFDGNHQHKALLGEMKERRRVGEQALTESKERLGE